MTVRHSPLPCEWCTKVTKIGGEIRICEECRGSLPPLDLTWQGRCDRCIEVGSLSEHWFCVLCFSSHIEGKLHPDSANLKQHQRTMVPVPVAEWRKPRAPRLGTHEGFLDSE